jgi:cysteine desulfurase
MPVRTPIYLDNHATTAIDPRVLEAMMPYLTEHFGNAASNTHVFGWTAESAVKVAREQIAGLIGAGPSEIVFTSGATEADNLAIKGAAGFYEQRGNRIVTVATEHKAVLDSCAYLELHGHPVTYLTPGPDGLVTPEQVADAVDSETLLVSVMLVNNEIGVIQPIEAIGAAIKAKNPKTLFHCDAVQGVGKIPFDVHAGELDLVSISAHKMYGPKGVGALWVRRRPRVRLAPQIHGGGHERGMRSGTLPVANIVGFGKACELAATEMNEESERVLGLRERLRSGLEARIEEVSVNGSLEHRVAGNLNMSFGYVEGEALLMALRDVAVSSGAACSSASKEPSYVLDAIGVPRERAAGSIRFGVGRFNTEAEIDYVIERVVESVDRLRSLSVAWKQRPSAAGSSQPESEERDDRVESTVSG